MLGAPERNDSEAMKEAARRSGAAEFIEQLPGGYEQVLGKEFEDGVDLSGGQWQKIAIARAFYEAPPVLILDEPTSAIDAEAEYDIFSNLEQQYKNKTLVLVSDCLRRNLLGPHPLRFPNSTDPPSPISPNPRPTLKTPPSAEKESSWAPPDLDPESLIFTDSEGNRVA